MTKQNFVDKILVKDLRYCKKPCKETEILSQAFQKIDTKEKPKVDDKNGKPKVDEKDIPIWIDIVAFKKALSIK